MLRFLKLLLVFGGSRMPTPGRGQITRILGAAGRGDRAAAEELLPLVYNELRRLARQRTARERPGQTLQPTALVHEAYLRLIGDAKVEWKNRGHFFGAAAEAMRRILIERARRYARVKHGAELKRVTLDDDKVGAHTSPEDLIALDEALTQLEAFDPRLGQIVALRYFAGLTIDETAKALGLSRTTIKDDWTFARAWLFDRLNSGPGA